MSACVSSTKDKIECCMEPGVGRYANDCKCLIFTTSLMAAAGYDCILVWLLLLLLLKLISPDNPVKKNLLQKGVSLHKRFGS